MVAEVCKWLYPCTDALLKIGNNALGDACVRVFSGFGAAHRLCSFGLRVHAHELTAKNPLLQPDLPPDSPTLNFAHTITMGFENPARSLFLGGKPHRELQELLERKGLKVLVWPADDSYRFGKDDDWPDPYKQPLISVYKDDSRDGRPVPDYLMKSSSELKDYLESSPDVMRSQPMTEVRPSCKCHGTRTTGLYTHQRVGEITLQSAKSCNHFAIT